MFGRLQEAAVYLLPHRSFNSEVRLMDLIEIGCWSMLAFGIAVVAYEEFSLWMYIRRQRRKRR